MDSFSIRLKKGGLLVDRYYTPMLCSLGTLGNILSLFVFLDSKFKSQSSAYYLTALALSDTGFLLNLFVFWLEDILHVGLVTNPVMCPLVMYLGQVTCFISVYLMIAFSIERYVAVHYPFTRLKYCTREVSRKVTLAIVFVALVLFSYAWVIAQVIEKKPPNSNSLDFNLTLLNISNTNLTLSLYIDLYNITTIGELHTFQSPRPVILRCSVPKQYYKISEIANYSDTVVTLIIPVILIASLNMRIFYSVRKIMMERKNILASEERRRSTLAIEDDESTTIQSRLVTDKQDDSYKRKQSVVRFKNVESELNTPTRSARNLKDEEQEACRILPERNRERKQQSNLEMKATKTLLLVSTVFLCLHLPLHTIRCVKFITYMRGVTSGKKILRALEPWGNVLFNTNFGINFIVYYASGCNFRETLSHLLPFARLQGRRQSSVISSQYRPRQSLPNYTTEMSSFEGTNFLARKTVDSRRNSRRDLLSLRNDHQLINRQSNWAGNVSDPNTDFEETVPV